MSLIIPERKLIFLHIPKCAGQSVEKALGFKHQHRHHKRNDLPENWFEYLRFTFVRHPLSRFLSACNYNLRVALNTRHELQSFRMTSSVPPSAIDSIWLKRDRP